MEFSQIENVSPVGWHVPADLTHDDWKQIGGKIREAEKSFSWFIADWLNAYPGEWGNMYDEAMEITGLSYQRLRNLKSLGKHIELSRRRDKLTVSHHEQVARLEPEKQTYWLDKAVSEDLSVSSLNEAISRVDVPQRTKEQEKNWITLDEWNELSQTEQTRVLGRIYFGQSNKFNKANDNIEWARWSWNPITGCLHKCAYCYARDIANRFYDHLPENRRFNPVFYRDRVQMPDNTKLPDLSKINDPVERMGQRNVFVCSMADLFGKWVPVEWINAVLESINRNPQWTFLLLTKFPVRMAEFTYPDNVWLGTTVDYQYTVKRAESAFIKIRESGFDGVCWLSCEPLMENLEFTSLEMFDWVVMGGASKSTQTAEFFPPLDWVVNLCNQARKANCKIYQKTNLIPGISDKQRIREYTSKEAKQADFINEAQMRIKAENRAKARQEKLKRKKLENMDRAVKDCLEAIKAFGHATDDAILAFEDGKFSPEGKRFAFRRLSKTIEKANKLRDLLADHEKMPGG